MGKETAFPAFTCRVGPGPLHVGAHLRGQLFWARAHSYARLTLPADARWWASSPLNRALAMGEDPVPIMLTITFYFYLQTLTFSTTCCSSFVSTVFEGVLSSLPILE